MKRVQLTPEGRAHLAKVGRARHADHVANPERVAHTIVREFFRLLSISSLSLTTLPPAAGVAINTVKGWRRGADPRLTLFIYGLNAIGYTLAIVPLEKDGAS